MEYALFERLCLGQAPPPNKSKWWIVDQYWRITKGKGWRFQPPGSDYQLYQHRSTPIRRHVKVQGRRSPYDPGKPRTEEQNAWKPRQQAGMNSYISPEQRVPADYPLHPLRKMTDEIFKLPTVPLRFTVFVNSVPIPAPSAKLQKFKKV